MRRDQQLDDMIADNRQLSRALSAAQEERENWKNAYTLLATEIIYDGNSVQHWHAKAKAYSGIVFQVCEAFRKLGYEGEFGDLPTLAARLNEFSQSLKV